MLYDPLGVPVGELTLSVVDALPPGDKLTLLAPNELLQPAGTTLAKLKTELLQLELSLLVIDTE